MRRAPAFAGVWAFLVTLAGGYVLLLSPLLRRRTLEFFQIDLAAFRIGRGIVLVTIGLEMMSGQLVKVAAGEDEDRSPREEVRVRFRQIFVPMSFSLIAGPGSITTVIIYSSRAEDWATLGTLALRLVGVLVLTLLALLSGRRLVMWVGRLPLEVATRVFGLFLVGIAAQFLTEGLGEVFPTLLNERSPVADERQSERYGCRIRTLTEARKDESRTCASQVV